VKVVTVWLAVAITLHMLVNQAFDQQAGVVKVGLLGIFWALCLISWQLATIRRRR
jgi:hypothetical protein